MKEELLAALSTYYAQLERRLETAANSRDPQVRVELATAAFELLLGSSAPSVAAELEPRRAEIVAALVAQQIALAAAVRTVARRLPRARFAGPINGAFTPLRRLTTKVVSSPGAVTAYCEDMRVKLNTETEIVEADKVTWADLADHSTALYGTPDNHHLLRDALAESGWEVAAGHIAIGGRRFEGEHLVIIACRARPGDPTLSDLVYAGANEQDVIGINFLHHGPSDYVIGRCTKPMRYQILNRGNFARGPEGEITTRLP